MRNLHASVCGIRLNQLYIVAAPHASADSYQLKREGGVLSLPVQVNSAITLYFLIDSGASDVVIPLDVFSTLPRAGTITSKDMLDSQTYELADGSHQKARRFRIRSLKIGSLELHDVVGSVAPTGGTPLLGQNNLRIIERSENARKSNKWESPGWERLGASSEDVPLASGDVPPLQRVLF
jgi:predicted aspartyl protease